MDSRIAAGQTMYSSAGLTLANAGLNVAKQVACIALMIATLACVAQQTLVPGPASRSGSTQMAEWPLTSTTCTPDCASVTAKRCNVVEFDPISKRFRCVVLRSDNQSRLPINKKSHQHLKQQQPAQQRLDYAIASPDMWPLAQSRDLSNQEQNKQFEDSPQGERRRHQLGGGSTSRLLTMAALANRSRLALAELEPLPADALLPLTDFRSKRLLPAAAAYDDVEAAPVSGSVAALLADKRPAKVHIKDLSQLARRSLDYLELRSPRNEDVHQQQQQRYATSSRRLALANISNNELDHPSSSSRLAQLGLKGPPSGMDQLESWRAKAVATSDPRQHVVRTAIEDQSLGCRRRRLRFNAYKVGADGSRCWGSVEAAICYGRCETGELASLSFPYKVSLHKVCTHGKRRPRVAILNNCSPANVDPSLRVYRYVDADSCVCQHCSQADTTCLGTITQPNIPTELHIETGQPGEQTEEELPTVSEL